MKDNKTSTKAIQAKSIGKVYRKFNRKRDIINSVIRGRSEGVLEKWAVKGVTFELSKGESIGIIGKNGSGKSTLLQMICGTVRPSEGELVTKGKISALLELGSGFSPEFTGLENIYLNAAIQGINKREMVKRIDDILEFADIGSAIFDPVRTYSSGMIVRLAFAVMANVDADILIIDEALAVGDSFFTQKCMRYIQEIRKEKALLLVSHDAGSILSLCDRAILLSEGKMKKIGSSKEVVEEYTKEIQEELANSYEELNLQVTKNESLPKSSEHIEAYKKRWEDYRAKDINQGVYKNILKISRIDQEMQVKNINNGDAAITSVKLINEERGKESYIVWGGEVCTLTIFVECYKEIKQPIVGFMLINSKGLVLLGDNTLNSKTDSMPNKVDNGCKIQAQFTFTMPLLPKDKYSITASVAAGDEINHRIIHWVNDIVMLESTNQSIETGLAGVAMHSIRIGLK